VPTMPRIARAIPKGSISRPEPPGLPVLARIRWYDGRDTDVPAIATAWTREAVEITWDAPGLGLRSDWIDARDVRRSASELSEQPSPPPISRGQRGRVGGIGPVGRR
jgi:hypothetical protein